MTQLVSIADLSQLLVGDQNRNPHQDSVPRLPADCRGGAVSIGNFDGVHRGHAVLLNRLRQMADRLGGPAVAVTFDPHPGQVLRRDTAPTRLTSMEIRAQRMTKLGIDTLVVCKTDLGFLNQSASEFFQSLIVHQLGARGIVEGPNFFFGRGREGDVGQLQEMAAQESLAGAPIQVEIVPPEMIADRSSRDPDSDFSHEMVSSSLIREALATGQVERAAKLLGCPHQIRGRVCQGAGRGRQIGFPTANLNQIDVLVPPNGVYAGWARIDAEEDAIHAAAIHLGPNPTFNDDQASKVEVHLIDYDGDLYGREMHLDFVGRVRQVQRFDSPDQLTRQLEKDLQTTRQILANSKQS